MSTTLTQLHITAKKTYNQHYFKQIRNKTFKHDKQPLLLLRECTKILLQKVNIDNQIMGVLIMLIPHKISKKVYIVLIFKK